MEDKQYYIKENDKFIPVQLVDLTDEQRDYLINDNNRKSPTKCHLLYSEDEI